MLSSPFFLVIFAVGVAHAAEPDEGRFTGPVGRVNTGCGVDATCSMEVGGREVVFGEGWAEGPWGRVEKLDPFDELGIAGTLVDVYGVRQGDHWTLAGSAEYFIRPAGPDSPRLAFDAETLAGLEARPGRLGPAEIVALEEWPLGRPDLQRAYERALVHHEAGGGGLSAACRVADRALANPQLAAHPLWACQSAKCEYRMRRYSSAAALAEGALASAELLTVERQLGAHWTRVAARQALLKPASPQENLSVRADLVDALRDLRAFALRRADAQVVARVDAQLAELEAAPEP